MTLVAFFRRSAATYEEGNVQSYSNCEIWLDKLESRLTIMKQIDATPPKYETLEDEVLRKVGVKEAESALNKAKHIRVTSNGYQWISGAGYAFSLPNLLIAATFGLTPNLLIKNLQKQAEKSISDLESTKPSVVGKVGNQ
jgi:hypothetical protein